MSASMYVTSAEARAAYEAERGEAWVCVQLLGSGYAAVMMHRANENGYEYPEPWDTGIGRYATYEEAEREARSWADAEELPFREV